MIVLQRKKLKIKCWEPVNNGENHLTSLGFSVSRPLGTAIHWRMEVATLSVRHLSLVCAAHVPGTPCVKYVNKVLLLLFQQSSLKVEAAPRCPVCGGKADPVIMEFYSVTACEGCKVRVTADYLE